MPTLPLPEEPNLEQLHNQARDLQRAIRAGEPDALSELVERYPDAPEPATLRLATAQAVVARRHGFTSWARLKHHVEVVERYSRYPARVNRTEPPDLADRFLRLACISYDDTVGPDSWAVARAIASDHPEISTGNVHVAAAIPNTVELARILRRDPAAARREGGPYRWEPLYYLAYARHDPDMVETEVLEAARSLLAAGANPNVGYLWLGHPPTFTALTGVFGEGEGGPDLQPRHPHSLALGRLLLEAGADPNDEQTLYNRMFRPGNDHLELLFEFGLGTGAGGPWKEQLGDAVASPAGMLGQNLYWSISHGLAERVRILLDHGVDAAGPLPNGMPPTVLAATVGHADLIPLLVEHGASEPELTLSQTLIAALLAGDRDEVHQLRAAHPGLITRVRQRRPGLVPWAATLGRPEVIRLLADLRWDINALGRTDRPNSNQAWHTALHHAAEAGDLDLARTLLDLGADPAVRDRRFDGTPLGWAQYHNRPALVELLGPLTPNPNVGVTSSPTKESQPVAARRTNMTTSTVSTMKTINVPGIGAVALTIQERGDGQPFLVLHGGAGPQSVAEFAQRLAEKGRNRVLTPTHPGFGGTPRPDELNSVAGLAALYSALLDDLGLEHVTVIGNSVGGWIAAEMALLGSPRIGGIALLDAVGIKVEGHPVADVSGLSVPEIQALSFHDPTPFRVDPAAIPDAQKTTMAANGAALAIYAGSPAMADPTLLGRLRDIAVPTLVLWGESDRIVEPAYGQAYAAAIHGAHFEVMPATGHMPQMETPDLVLRSVRDWAGAHYNGS